MKCIECKDGEFVLVRKTFTRTVIVDCIKKRIHIPNIRARVCNSCGNTILDAKDARQLENEIKRKTYNLSEKNRRKQIREYLDDESV